jgi:hypothetical protein
MARKAKNARRARYAGLQAGVRKLWMKQPTRFAGKLWKGEEIVEVLQTLLDADNACDLAYAAYRGKVQQRRALEKRWGFLVRAVTGLARVQHGQDPATLGAFGLDPSPPTGPQTLAVKVASAEKLRATRALRGTKGKKRRRR